MVRSLQNSEKKLLVLKISDIFDNAINSTEYRDLNNLYIILPKCLYFLYYYFESLYL